MRNSRKKNITLLKKFLDDFNRNNNDNPPKPSGNHSGMGKPKPRH